MEYAIQVDHVKKAYKLYDNNKQRLKEALFPRSSKRYYREFLALDDVSFNVAKGDIVGIIGTNGSGKSTILKIITGVLQATNGIVQVNGRISALLELGAGFNMEYTGLENIRLNGMMLGLSAEEIEKRIPEILNFAEIGDFIHQPVKTYSSGMFARLAFAVSINVEPDILIIDEALSVGDMYFQEKCYEKMKQMVKTGATVLFVSHSLPAVRNFCKKAVWLEKGHIRSEGRADEVVNEYKQYLESKLNQDATVKNEAPVLDYGVNLAKKEKNKILIRKVELNRQCYYMNEDITLRIGIDYRVENVKFGVGIIVRNAKNEIVTLFNTIRDDIIIEDKIPEVILSLPANDFVEGTYSVSVNLCDEQAMYPLDVENDIAGFRIVPLASKHGIPIAEGYFRHKHDWSVIK